MTGTSTAGHNLILPENWQHINGKNGEIKHFTARDHIFLRWERLLAQADSGFGHLSNIKSVCQMIWLTLITCISVASLAF